MLGGFFFQPYRPMLNGDLVVNTSTWTTVPQTGGAYEIRVIEGEAQLRSWKRQGRNTDARRDQPKVLVPSKHTTTGRHSYTLTMEDGSRRFAQAGWWVLWTFVGAPQAGRTCCHGPKGMHINSLDNLYWGTKEDDTRDREAYGGHTRGANNGHAKLTREQVIQARQSTEPTTKLAHLWGVSTEAVRYARTGKSWRHLNEEYPPCTNTGARGPQATWKAVSS